MCVFLKALLTLVFHHEGFDYDIRKSLGSTGWKRCWNQTLHLCGLRFVFASGSGADREVDCFLTASPRMNGGSANNSPDCVTDLFIPMSQTGAEHVQIEFAPSSKGFRFSPRSRLVPKLQIDVGKEVDPQALGVAVAADAGVPNMTFARNLVCDYTGFDVGSGPAGAGARVEQAEGSQLFEARAVLAKYYMYIMPRRNRDNYVPLFRRKFPASNPSDPLDDSDDSRKPLRITEQLQAMAIGQGMCTTLARRLAHQASWLPQWSCGRLVVGITRLAIARLIPKLLLALQGVRPVERQLSIAVAPTWQLLRAAWNVGADAGNQRTNQQAASECQEIGLNLLSILCCFDLKRK